jgi:hypothetical protein
MWKDVKFKTYHKLVVAPQTVTADVNSASVDTQDLSSLGFLVAVGAFTFTNANRIDLKLQHSDDGTTWVDVAQEHIYADTTAPIVKSLVAAGDASKTHLVEYRGGKRYVRLVLDVSGTVSVPTSAIAISLDPEKMPPL